MKRFREHIKQAGFLTYTIPVVALNTLVSLYISYPIFRENAATGGASLITDLIPFVGHYFMLALAVGLAGWLAGLVLPARFRVGLNTLLFLALQGFLVIDLQIYQIYHYHINGLVLNILMTEGAGDSVTLGTGTIMSFILIMLGILAFELVVNLFFGLRAARFEGRRRKLLRRAAAGILAAGILVMAADKGMFAWADIVDNVKVTSNAKLYPLYQPLTIKSFASKVLGIKVNREQKIDLSRENSLLNYPRETVKMDPEKFKGYNYVIVMLEGARYDMLDPQIMPYTWALGQRSMVFDNHYSGGNATRFGVFSIIYGLHGTYWHNFLATRTPPVLIDTLMEKNYGFLILSATKLTYPEFRDTAFRRVQEHITDRWPVHAYPVRDRMITDRLEGFIANRPSEQPFFAFLSFNSSHEMYKYPPEYEKFTPVVPKEINYFKDATPESAHKIRNRYKNSLYYDDHLIGRIVNTLDAAGLMDSTVLIVTGDHGEEFFEHGLMGHTSSFSDYQIKTPFVVHYPGETPRRVERLTSHVDIVPTIMESLGAASPPGVYSQGVSLLEDADRQYVASSGWDTAALIFKDLTVTFSTESYNMGGLDIRDKDTFNPIEDRGAFMSAHRDTLLSFTKEMAEFYR